MPKPAGITLSEKLALYEKLVATNSKIERKGDTVLYTSLNGHMFSYLSREGKIALRLPAAEREAFLNKYSAKLCEAYGRVQPEYVEVPDSLRSATKEFEGVLRPQLSIRRFPQTEADRHKKEEGLVVD